MSLDRDCYISTTPDKPEFQLNESNHRITFKFVLFNLKALSGNHSNLFSVTINKNTLVEQRQTQMIKALVKQESRNSSS